MAAAWQRSIWRKCARKVRKGSMGYDQYTVCNDCCCRTYFCCYPLHSQTLCPCAILSNFFEEQCTQSHPQLFSWLSRALFPTTFLELNSSFHCKAVKCYVYCSWCDIPSAVCESQGIFAYSNRTRNGKQSKKKLQWRKNALKTRRV